MAEAGQGRAGGSEVRRRIIAAVEALAVERGPGNISIEAVAARAGLSKGGVLYHFRTKADLLAALVSSHVEDSRCLVERTLAADGAGPNALAEALIEAHRVERSQPLPAPSGVLAAVAAHPDFLDPLRAHQMQMLTRIRHESADPELATIAFLTLQGLKSLHLFGFDLLGPEQEDQVLRRLAALLRVEETA